jgi:ribosomal protein S18 acetylase RimI-like enzyme
MTYPNVRRAASDDQDRLGELWLDLLNEQAEHDDRLVIAEDARERWNNDFPVWLEDETCRIYVAETETAIVGFVSVHRWGPPPIYEASSELYLDELYVAPSARREGYGTQLVHAVVDWADRLQARRIRLSTLSANEAAQAFWTSQDAVPMTTTFTLERSPEESPGDGSSEIEGSKKIGFQ